VNFLNFGIDAAGGLNLTKQVVDCARPTMTFDEITMPIYNSTMYLAGKGKWSTIAINIRDDASGTVAKAVGQQIQKQMDFVEQASAATGQDYKFQTNIEILDGGNGVNVPQVLETWELYGCFVQNVVYGALNYGTSDVVTVQLTLRYDNAVQAPIGSGIGTSVGRAFGGSSATGIGGTT
jgi:hypothetical protein